MNLMMVAEPTPPARVATAVAAKRKKGGTGDRDYEEERFEKIKGEDELILKMMPNLIVYLN